MSSGFTARRALTAGAVYIGAVGSAYLYFGRKPKGDEIDGTECCGTQLRVWDKNAGSYDKEVGLDETLMGLSLMRRWLLRNAKGSVLEVSAGTGRNTKYYNGVRCSTLTITDSSQGMLDVAKTKATKLPSDCVIYEQCSVEALPYANDTFDTVVDTFGLCSCDTPEKALDEMTRVCKPGGQILLLEHGRSHYGWMNRILDSNAAQHFERWGCKWNRNILDLVDTAKRRLAIQSVSRFHFGTTYLIKSTPAAATANETTK